jgi:hypothetical protein
MAKHAHGCALRGLLQHVAQPKPGKRGPYKHLANRIAEEHTMGRQVVVGLYVAAMIAIIVGVDVAFFRNRFWERLLVNVGIVLVFAAFYLRFLQAFMRGQN